MKEGPLSDSLPSHHETADAILEAQGVEIEQQSNSAAAHSEIGQDLSFMDRQQSVDRLDLEDQFACNDNVGTESRFQRHALIDHWHRELPFKVDSGLLQFEA